MQTENAQQKYCFALIGICLDLRCVYKQTKYDKINRCHSAYMGTNVITLHRFYEYFIGYSCPDVCKWSLSCGCLSNMLLVLSITFVITIYRVVCVQLAHFSWGDWKGISIAHVIIIIKLEVSPYPLLSYISMVVCLRCLLHHILSLIAHTFWEN